MAKTMAAQATPNATNLISEYGIVFCNPDKAFSDGIFRGEYPWDFSTPRLMLQATLVLVFSNVVRLILKPLGQPAIISDIIGGILIGPSGLGNNAVFKNSVFPPKSLDALKVISNLAAVYVLFIIGVKQDAKVIINSGRKSWLIATIGTVFPFVILKIVFLTVPPRLVANMGSAMLPQIIVNSISLTAFPSVHPILAELNLLNSKLGRVAMSAATNVNAAGWTSIVLFGAARQGTNDPFKGFCYLLSTSALILFIFVIIRPLMFYVISQTPDGKPINKAYIVSILLGVLVIAFVSDFIGATATNGALILGLAMPDGPPLGAAIVDKTESILQYFFLPLLFANLGLDVNVFGIRDWGTWRTLMGIVVIGHTAKIIGYILPSRFYNIPTYDSIAFSLSMNFRGLPEIIVFSNMLKYRIMTGQTYTSMVTSTLLTTAIATPLVKWLGGQSRLYAAYGIRTIEHTKVSKELRMLTCIHRQENVPTMINLLEATHASKDTPINLCVLNLVELQGRAAPMLISHNLRRRSSSSSMNHINKINNAFRQYKQQKHSSIMLQMFTSVSPYKTMYQDICMLALDKKSSLIVLPFHRQQLVVQNLNWNVLNEAPCSVGILVDNGGRGNLFARDVWCFICIIFMGGADDREALSYGFRIGERPNVTLDVVRIRASTNVSNDWRDGELDDDLIRLFRTKFLNVRSVVYREEVVSGCDESINIIRGLANKYNLFIVGRRRQKGSSKLVRGLSPWCENQELGVIGDFVASPDFSRGTVSVLVIQQQINASVVTFDAFDDEDVLSNKKHFATAFQ